MLIQVALSPDIRAGLTKASARRVDVGKSAQLDAFVKQCAAVVSAAPYFLNKSIASATKPRRN